MSEKQERDANLDNSAVVLYRRIFSFCPNRGFRNDIAVTVTNLNLWRTVLLSWGYQMDDKWISFNPLNVKGMLSEYERLERKQC